MVQKHLFSHYMYGKRLKKGDKLDKGRGAFFIVLCTFK